MVNGNAKESFFRYAWESPALKERLIALEQERLEHIATLAGEEGYDITVSDLKEWQESFEQSMTDDEMAQVSGGIAYPGHTWDPDLR